MSESSAGVAGIPGTDSNTETTYQYENASEESATVTEMEKFALLFEFDGDAQISSLNSCVIYTLDFALAASMLERCKNYCVSDPEIIQISVSKVTSRHNYDQQPAPWIISCKAGE